MPFKLPSILLLSMHFERNEILQELMQMSAIRAHALRRVDETLQNMSSGVLGDKILTTEFKDRFLETVAESQTFLAAGTRQDASNAIVATFERELTQMNLPDNLTGSLR